MERLDPADHQPSCGGRYRKVCRHQATGPPPVSNTRSWDPSPAVAPAEPRRLYPRERGRDVGLHDATLLPAAAETGQGDSDLAITLPQRTRRGRVPGLSSCVPGE